MDFYMYKSLCPRWYGIENNIRHIVVAKDTTEQNVKQQAQLTHDGRNYHRAKVQDRG